MHTLAWASWVGMVMVLALSTSNPLYLGVILLSILLVAVLAPKTNTGVAGFRALLTLGLSLFAISLGIAVINGSYGEQVLFTVPGPDLPSWLGGLRIGGPVSAEGLVAAAIRGEAILCVFLAFATLNAAVSPYRVLRTTPAALFHAGLVVTVGLTLLPSTIEDVRRIREVQALRGARTGLRSLPALVVPAVINGLERSKRLAEAIEARGYASAPPQQRGAQIVGLLSAPLFLGAVWAWFYYESFRPLAAVALAAGVAALGWWAWSAAKNRHATRLHTETVTFADRATIALSLAVMVLAVAADELGIATLGYNPFDGLEPPPFTLAGGLLSLCAAWPALRLVFAPAPRERTAVDPSFSPEVAR
jgi:energy-coupling factor transport system permease protein